MKFPTTLLLATIVVLSLSFSSCNSYHSIRDAKSVAQLSANPFMQKVARSVMQGMTQNIISKGMTSFKGKPLLRSSLSSLLNTSQSVSSFKNMLTTTYGIGKGSVDANYDKMKTVRDVVGFVAKNGKRFNFNSYSNKLY